MLLNILLNSQHYFHHAFDEESPPRIMHLEVFPAYFPNDLPVISFTQQGF